MYYQNLSVFKSNTWHNLSFHIFRVKNINLLGMNLSKLFCIINKVYDKILVLRNWQQAAVHFNIHEVTWCCVYGPSWLKATIALIITPLAHPWGLNQASNNTNLLSLTVFDHFCKNTNFRFFSNIVGTIYTNFIIIFQIFDEINNYSTDRTV